MDGAVPRHVLGPPECGQVSADEQRRHGGQVSARVFAFDDVFTKRLSENFCQRVQNDRVVL